MNKTRLPVVIMTVALLSAAGLALLSFFRTTQAMGNIPISSGMGDLRLIEAQHKTAPGGASEKSNSYIGMGDLHRLEAPASSHPYLGMGDLQLFEAQQNAATGGALGKINPYIGMGELRRYEAPVRSIGMGDLRRIEAGQVLAATNESSSQQPGRVCTNPSTSYGERDAGVSAPAYVLHAKGCLEQVIK